MDTNKVTMNSPAEIICFLPYMLGYQPTDRFCVMGTQGAPTAALEHPHDPEALLAAAANLGASYRRHGGVVVLVAYTDDTDHALDAITAVTAMLDGYVEVKDAVVVNSADRWFAVDGRQGTVTHEDRSKIAAAAAFTGLVTPAASREAQRHMLDVDPQRAALVEPLITPTAQLLGNRLSDWARDRAAAFTYDQETVTDADAARLIAAASTGPGLTAILDDLNQDAAKRQHPLWVDLMRRCPQTHRSTVAGIVALSAWLTGNGAVAWHALDTIPEHEQRTHRVAKFTHRMLTEAVHPKTWTGWSATE